MRASRPSRAQAGDAEGACADSSDTHTVGRAQALAVARVGRLRRRVRRGQHDHSHRHDDARRHPHGDDAGHAAGRPALFLPQRQARAGVAAGDLDLARRAARRAERRPDGGGEAAGLRGCTGRRPDRRDRLHALAVRPGKAGRGRRQELHARRLRGRDAGDPRRDAAAVRRGLGAVTRRGDGEHVRGDLRVRPARPGGEGAEARLRDRDVRQRDAGTFDFKVPFEAPNGVARLVVYERSAADGSKTHVVEIPISLAK